MTGRQATAAVAPGRGKPRRPAGSAVRSGSRRVTSPAQGTEPSMTASRSPAPLIVARHAAQQRRRVGMRRRAEQLRGLGALDHAACVHDHHPMGLLGDDTEIVGNEQDAHAQLGLQVRPAGP